MRRATDVEQVPTALRTITREVLGLALEALFVALDESINDKVELDTVVAAERNHRQVAHTLLVWLHKLGVRWLLLLPCLRISRIAFWVEWLVPWQGIQARRTSGMHSRTMQGTFCRDAFGHKHRMFRRGGMPSVRIVQSKT